MKRETVLEIISSLFILLFTYAASSKLLDLQRFQVNIAQSPMLAGIAPFVSIFIPLSEVIVSILLTIPKLRLAGLFGSFSLMVMFTGYIFTIYFFSDHVPCSCGGVLQKLGWGEHMVFNLGFVILAVIGIVIQSNIRKQKLIESADHFYRA